MRNASRTSCAARSPDSTAPSMKPRHPLALSALAENRLPSRVCRAEQTTPYHPFAGRSYSRPCCSRPTVERNSSRSWQAESLSKHSSQRTRLLTIPLSFRERNLPSLEQPGLMQGPRSTPFAGWRFFTHQSLGLRPAFIKHNSVKRNRRIDITSRKWKGHQKTG